MYVRLPWSKIAEAYSGEWVELIDYQWDLGRAFPKWGVVRHANRDRSTLLAKITASKSYPNSITLFIHSNQHPLIQCEEWLPAL